MVALIMIILLLPVVPEFFLAGIHFWFEPRKDLMGCSLK